MVNSLTRNKKKKNPNKLTKFQKFKRNEPVFTILVYLLVIIFVIITIYPLIYILSSSFSSPHAVFTNQVILFPVDPSIESYRAVFKNNDIWIGFKNSLIYCTVGTLLSTAVTFLTAYPLTRKDLKGRKFFITLYTITMFFGGGIVPLYMVIKNMNMLNTMWALILPGCVNVYNLIVVRTYITSSIPQNLQDAAKIDGASDFRIFLRIIVPLCKPIMVIMILFYFVGFWNNYFSCLIFITDSNKYTLQQVVQKILTTTSSTSVQAIELAEATKYSTIIISTLPILFVYPFLAKYFEKGMMVGSIK